MCRVTDRTRDEGLTGDLMGFGSAIGGCLGTPRGRPLGLTWNGPS